MPKQKKIRYSKQLCCFDIETTHEVIDGMDCLYTWHWQAIRDTEYLTFTSWADFLDKVVTWNDADRTIVFVHNLSYETESIIRNLGDHVISEVFATDTHKMLKFVLDDVIEFRCSYFLTNKSLASCAEDCGLQKLEMDYQTIRRPGEPVSDSDELYCAWDVLIMWHKIRQLEAAEGMPFWDFPLTNTGFLRNEARKVMRHDKRNRKLFTSSRMDYKKFMCCKDAFMGGYTHANYIYMGEVMHGVDSFDYGSAYPFAMLAHKYPMGALHRVDSPNWNDIKAMINRKDVLFICRVQLRGVKSKLLNTYLSFSKCKTSDDVELDNGRIYSCTQLETACTSLDLKIIFAAYEVKAIRVLELYWSRADYLPPEYLRLMLRYYKDKQELKNVAGREIDYMKAKNRVNSFYGMAVTNPIHDIIELHMDTAKWEKVYQDYKNEDVINGLLDEFYKSWNSFLPYQWGVFVPAWTRYHLWMDFIRYNDRRTLYCDTDSAKVIDVADCLPYIEKYNKWVEEIKAKRLADLGIDESFPDLGVFDWETKKKGAWAGFKTLGAKKYLVQYKDGTFASTVAGMSKSAVEYIMGFDDFTPGTIFDADISGRTVSRCIDNPQGVYDDGGGCWIENTTYQLTISPDYALHANYPDRFPFSDLVISATERRHTGVFTVKEKINRKLLRDKRNIYGVEI